MADPATRADAPSRRRRHRERRKRRLRRIAATIATIVLLAGFVLVATDVVRFGGNEKPLLAGTAHPVGETPDDTPTGSTVVNTRPCRTLTAADPLRLWVGGDSLAGSLGPSLGAITGATGVVQPYFDSRVSSGLSDPGFFDWPDHATHEMERLSPEIVVFIIGANDWTAVTGDAWKTNYAQQVDTMMTTLIGTGRTVYWIGSPTLKDEKMDAAVVEVNAVAREEAKRHPEVQYIDAYKLFSDRDGKFATDLPDETGKVVTMRAGDGVHLTMDGAGYLARSVYKLVDAQCAVTEQKVAGAAKTTIESEGSTQVAPGATSGSSSGSSGGSVATTPPATTTTPPTSSPPTSTTLIIPQPTAPATTTPFVPLSTPPTSTSTP
jgi:hypothetical protein